jgi:nucleoside 2-deoxyribosyltransferase
MRCHFCKRDVSKSAGRSFGASSTLYDCPVCGKVNLTNDAASIIEAKISDEQKRIISIVLRNNYENRGREPAKRPLSSEELLQIAKTVPLDPIDRMDNALLILGRKSKYFRQLLKVDSQNDFTRYHCLNPTDLQGLLVLLCKEGYIEAREDSLNPQNGLSLDTKGYQRLRELRKTSDSRQCFVAMWFTDEMHNEAYLKAINPAIEYVEEGEVEPKFKAVKIDGVKHINDINDEIIAQIRRSRFMVCDLTGYRGGVYFEAGFAYGLGLDVIYTCRKDWSKEEILKDAEGKPVEELKDSNGVPIRVRKEGVHFDLAHRNRIEWTMDDLPGFKEKLENRIKAVIV